MRGFELEQERARLRTTMRRLADHEGFNARSFLALDMEALIKRADLQDQNAQGNAVKRRLVLAGLRNAGASVEAIAAGWSVTPEMIAAWMEPPLIDNRGTAQTIEHEVLEQLPETPEPGRVVPPELAIAPGWVRAQSEPSS